VLERDGGKIARIEVKTSATVKPEDFTGLRVLAEARGDRFSFGVMHYSRSNVVPFGKKLAAAPLASLWAREAPTNQAGTGVRRGAL